MPAEPCRDRLDDLGALLSGRLGADREASLRAHLEGCAACRQALDEVGPVAELLARAGPDALARPRPDPEPPGDLGERIVAVARRARRARRRRRLLAVGGAAGATAALLALVLAVLTSPSEPTAGREVRFDSADGVEADAVLVERSWGTEIELDAAGLEPGEVYWLWLTGEEGHRVPAGTFRGSASRAEVVLAAALPLRDARRVWVTDEEDAVVLDAHLSPPPG